MILRNVSLVVLIALGVGLSPVLSLAQGEITPVEQGGGLPGVPANVPIAGQLTTQLDAGEYQWQTTNLVTGDRADDPLEVHRGFLLSIDQSMIVIKAGAPSRAVAPGENTDLAEGERLKAQASGETPGRFVLVEFVNVADLRDNEAPDQILPVSLETGTYTIALLDITNLDVEELSAGQLLKEAAGPGFSIESKSEDDADEIPLVIWLAGIFETGGEWSAHPEPTAVNDGETFPTVASPDIEIDRIENESELTPSIDDEGKATPLPTSEPTIEPTPDSFSDDVDEAPSVASDAPVLTGVPAEIPVVSYAVYALPAGDYQWQTRNLVTHTRGEHDVMMFGDGFIIATQGPVTVFRSNETSVALDQGEALSINRGDEILPTSTDGGQISFLVVELVPVDEATDPDLLQDAIPLTLPAGIYAIAVLDVSGVGADGPTPGEIIGGAAGPGFGIGDPGQNAGDADLNWLVSLFAATDEDLIEFEALD